LPGYTVWYLTMPDRPNIISLGCDIAEVHHHFSEVQSTLFGAASFRLALAVALRRRGLPYQSCLQPLEQLQARLSELAAKVPKAGVGLPVQQAEQLRTSLSQYAATLSTAITQLHSMCHALWRDEAGYRATSGEGRSAFHRDMIQYDHVLMQLDKLGSRLNQLFARY
jgi:hypothetical protein